MKNDFRNDGALSGSIPLADQGAMEAVERGDFDAQGALSTDAQTRTDAAPEGAYGNLQGSLYLAATQVVKRFNGDANIRKAIEALADHLEDMDATAAHHLRSGMRYGLRQCDSHPATRNQRTELEKDLDWLLQHDPLLRRRRLGQRCLITLKEGLERKSYDPNW